MSFHFKIIPLLASLFASLSYPAPSSEIRSFGPKSDSYATLSCKTGFKPGKTPVSLVIGAKPGCYDTKLAAAGKKLLTGTANTCFACHSVGGIVPFKQMILNLRAQSYTLKPASITAAFQAHASEMSGEAITTRDAKALSHFFQSIR